MSGESICERLAGKDVAEKSLRTVVVATSESRLSR
jgi:hypothetical protein